MSLDIYLEKSVVTPVVECNITHNIVPMAKEAGLYYVLWRADELYETAADMVDPLVVGIAKLRADPDRFRKMNPENGWGDYDGLLRVAEKVLDGCREYPDAKPRCSR